MRVVEQAEPVVAPESEPNTDPGPEDPEIPEITAARATTAGYPMYQILWQWQDRLGTPFVLRRGYYNAATDKGFGFDKVYWKHNLTERAVMATTKWPRVRTHIGGTTWNYDTDVLRVRCSGWGRGVPARWWRRRSCAQGTTSARTTRAPTPRRSAS
ncbi:hypothetical protein ACRAKI_20745 [Saccharothrix isguenensis]